MERINPFSFYEMSKTLKTVAALTSSTPAYDCFWPLASASSDLAKLRKGDPIQLGVSSASAEALEKYIDKIIADHLFEPDGAGGSKFKAAPMQIPDWAWAHYKTLLTTFETVLAEEMREITAYYVPRRGIFYTPALVDSADESFPVELRPFLPDKTRYDWRAAGRCLAFNLLSASGFHVARAVEGVVEAYYQFFSGKPGHTLASWNEYAKTLDALNKADAEPKPSAKVIAELLQMKDDYRNPIVHPRVVLNEADARMLFNNGESLIIAMLQELIEARHTGVQPILALAGGG